MELRDVLRWVPDLVPLAQARSLHSSGTRVWHACGCCGVRAANAVRSLPRLRGRVGVGACLHESSFMLAIRSSLSACPLPVPPPQAGEGTLEPMACRQRELRPGNDRRKGSAHTRQAHRIQRVSYAKSHVDTHHVQEPNMRQRSSRKNDPSHKTNTRKRHAVICPECRGTIDRARGFCRVHRGVAGLIRRRDRGVVRPSPRSWSPRPPTPPASSAR